MLLIDAVTQALDAGRAVGVRADARLLERLARRTDAALGFVRPRYAVAVGIRIVPLTYCVFCAGIFTRYVTGFNVSISDANWLPEGVYLDQMCVRTIALGTSKLSVKPSH